MTSTIDALITQIENETGISANTKTRIGTVLRAISNERPYTVFSGLLNQPSTGTPTVVTLQNNTGRTWTIVKTGAGVFFAQSNIAFNQDKVAAFLQGSNGSYTYSSRSVSTTDVLFSVLDPNVGGSDGVLDRTAFEIRIYN